MDRGSRLVNLFQTLEKINSQRSGSKYCHEDLQQIRYVTSKVHQYVISAEKIHRELINKNSAYIELLLTTLDASQDACVTQNLLYILLELVGKSHSGKRSSNLVSHGATQVLFHVLVSESKEQTPPEELLLSIHQVLAKLGSKDRKFGVKARLSQALPVTLGLVRNHTTNTKLLLPVLQVLKLYSNNAVNASYLGKSGAVTHLFKVLAVCGRKHLTLVKVALDTLSLLVKSKSNSARAIGQGGVPILLTMFYDWHRLDSKNRHISLRKAILNVMKHVTNLKSGRKALMEADGIRILYTSCQESLDCRELEGLIFTASLIMRKCFPKNRLPLSGLRSPLNFDLPESDFHVVDSGEGQDGSLCVLDQLQLRAGEDNGYESSVDNDDDVSSDDDPEAHKIDSEEDAVNDGGEDPSYHRSWEDLSLYNKFFPELQEFDNILYQEDVAPAIVIPTACPDLYGHHEKLLPFRTSQSATLIHPTKRIPRPNRNSCPSLMHYRDSEDVLAGLRELGLSRPPDLEGESEGSVSGYSAIQTRARMSELLSINSDITHDSSGPSAFNMKTGSSVFSLDISRRIPKQQSPKSRRRSIKTGKGAAGKEKRARYRGKAEDWLPPCSSIPLPIAHMVSSEQSLDVDSDEEDNSSAETEEDLTSTYENAEVYMDIAARTRSVGRFNKVAYPDLHGHVPPPHKEPLHEKKFGVQRMKIFEDIDRMIHPDQVIDRVVYDLDSTVAAAGYSYMGVYSMHNNRDEFRISRVDEFDFLRFNSQFECGNLRKVIQVRRYEYDLILNPDVNTNHHHQWFYFEVCNMEAGVPYRFNIVNCEKPNSQFNFGMRPVMYSVTEALQGRPYWFRAGTQICYYRNHFIRSSQTTGGVRGKAYYTSTFSITFKHSRDVCYMAYHYPYTYSMLQANIYKWENMYDNSNIYFRNQVLTETLSGNPVPVLTITSYPPTFDREGVEQLKNRPYIFLSARVHPGESNSSWVMKGSIQFLLSDKPSAQALRDMYIFKIVPMLNPDGVINGNHRCSLVAEDLNRRWMQPCPKLHPTIYHTKGLLQYLAMVNKPPLVFCDYHGHSRRKNVFMYGCSPSLSWMTEDVDNPAISVNKVEDTGYKTLPRILQNLAPSFSMNNCSFMVEKSKETTARVVVWRQIGIVRSYTMESSYCGCDQGPYRGQHITTRELEEMGRKFCEALARVKSRHVKTSSNGGGVASTHTGETLDSNLIDMGLEGAAASASSMTDANLELASGSNTSSSSSNSEESDEEEERDFNFGS